MITKLLNRLCQIEEATVFLGFLLALSGYFVVMSVYILCK